MAISFRLKDQRVRLEQLMLDPNNYRLAYEKDVIDYRDDEVVGLQSETQKRLVKEKLADLKSSIRENGFLEVDRIVVRRLVTGNKDKLYLVVEGNRRTAAFKALISEHEKGLVILNQDLLDKRNSINVIVIDGNKEEIHRYSSTLMGIRHVSGPKKWVGIQSARLIHMLSKEGKTSTQIGALLGISSSEAERRGRGYKAYLQMSKDTKYGKKMLTKYYTLLNEFLSKRTGYKWLEWSDKKGITNKEKRTRLYQALTKKDGEKNTEIYNPASARNFLSALSIERFRKKIEQGISINQLGVISDEEASTELVLEEFYNFLEHIDFNNVSENGRSIIKNIVTKSESLLKENMN